MRKCVRKQNCGPVLSEYWLTVELQALFAQNGTAHMNCDIHIYAEHWAMTVDPVFQHFTINVIFNCFVSTIR